MGFFGRNKSSILCEAFFKVAFEQMYLDRLQCLEAGARKEDILRDTDYSVSSVASVAEESLKEADAFFYNAITYLTGRLVWSCGTLQGKSLEKLYTKESLKNVTEENAVESIITKWSLIEADPDQYLSADYDPSIIFYSDIENLRLVEKAGERLALSLRTGSGFTFSISVKSSNPINNIRSTLANRDTIRFLNSRIAEKNLSNK
jgi:hypothetical protein